MTEPAARDLILVVAAAILSGERCLVGQRRRGDSLGGMWEFPGGKVELEESLEAAIHREIAEELATEIRILSYLGEEIITRPDRDIRLCIFLTELAGPEPQPIEHEALRWLGAGEFEHLPLAPADRFAIPQVELELRARRFARRS